MMAVDMRTNTRWTEMADSGDDKPFAVAVDLGGTNMRVALVDREGQVYHRRSAPTQSQQGRDSVVERLVSEIEHILEESGEGTVSGIGISIAGPADPTTGVVYVAPNIAGWEAYSPKEELEQRFSLRTVVVNDANAAALAEHRFGAGRGHRYMVFVTISTGVGGGVIVNGELYAGAYGFAGEIGHTTINMGGPQCTCGNLGCLEVMGSGTAVARIAKQRLGEGATSSLREMSDDQLQRIDARMVMEAARHGDQMAEEVVDEVATALGFGMVNILHSFDPDVIVVGGGMSQNLDLLLPKIQAVIRTRGLPLQRDREPIVKAELGDDMGLLGAAALVFGRS